MANIKASKKDIITNKRNRDRNVAFKSKMKTAVKKAVSSIASGDEDATAKTREALRTIDKLASKGILHKGTAARKKSKLMKKVNETTSKKPAAKKVSEPKKAKKTTEAKKSTPKASTAKKAANSDKTKSAKKTTKK